MDDIKEVIKEAREKAARDGVKFDLPKLLEEHRQKKANWKPQWMPKKKREALEKQKAEEEKKKEEEREAQEAAEKRDRKRKLQSGEPNGRDQRRDRPQYQQPQQPQHQQQQQQQKPAGPTKHSRGAKRTAEEEDQARWRERYLGPEVNKHSTFVPRKKNRTTEFNFDWNPLDDTSRVNDPFYKSMTAQRAKDAKDGPRYDAAAEARERARAEQFKAEGDPERAEMIMESFYRRREAEKQRMRNEEFKNRTWKEKSLSEMTERDWRRFTDEFDITLKPPTVARPMRYWDESTIAPELKDTLATLGYTDPTPIQRGAIPVGLGGRDLIGVAATGSGKTIAFLLPLLTYLARLAPLTEANKNDGPYALILAPTRELAQQIEAEGKKFASALGFTCFSIVGGHSMDEQSSVLSQGVEVVVATPGRLIDLLERRRIVLAQCCYVVMDEADRMIDFGFEEPVQKILSALPTSNQKPDSKEAEDPVLMNGYVNGRELYRQTMMYTATMNDRLERIARTYLRRPATVKVAAGEAVDTVEQRVELINDEGRRKERLRQILASGEFVAPIIVFVNVKRNCDAIANEVNKWNFSVVSLHGGKSQDQREASLNAIRNRQTDVLVTTDVAARGIDIADVSLVINFNMATSIEKYTHRIGRTGRAGKTGVAITFLGDEDKDVMYELKGLLTRSPVSRLPEELRRHEAAQQRSTRPPRG